MTVKTGQSWAGTFVTLDSTGALATGTPSGVLYVDGVANGATVTVSGSNPYKWSVTLPSLTPGQRVDMYITATISSIATAGIVASDQADTALLSDGVVVNSGTVTTLTNLPAVTTDWLTAAAVKADAVTKIQSGLATPTNITAGTITTATNLTNLPSIPAGWITAAGIATGAIDADAIAADAIGADEIAAGAVTKIQSGLATQTSVNAIPTAPLLAANYTAPDNATIGTIAGNVDDLETRLTAARAGYLDKLNVSGTLAHSNDAATYKADVSGLATSTEVGAIALLGETVIGSYTVQDILKILAAKMVGKATGGGTATITYRGVDDTSDVIIETVDSNGNRSAVTLTV